MEKNNMAASNADPITSLQPPEQQHMLLLFLPVKKGLASQLATSTDGALAAKNDAPDLRAATGVHFFMITAVADGAKSTLPVPTFTAAKGKDLMVVLSIYDAPFSPYIGAFTKYEEIAKALDGILFALDETGIITDDKPTSAAFILKHGGVFKNKEAFVQLLMRYNFADPTIPAATGAGIVPAGAKYFMGGTFPGLTVGNILQKYPDAPSLWPATPVPITFEQ
jgi:hypothetical protein